MSASLLRVLGAGLALGVVWRLVAPVLSGASDRGESQVAVDASFFVMAAALGGVTALAFLRRPGQRPSLRLALLLGGAVAASGLAVAVSWALGGPVLVAWGGLLIWPWATALITALVATVGLLIGDRGRAAAEDPSSDHPLDMEDSVKD